MSMRLTVTVLLLWCLLLLMITSWHHVSAAVQAVLALLRCTTGLSARIGTLQCCAVFEVGCQGETSMLTATVLLLLLLVVVLQDGSSRQPQPCSSGAKM
jgi:hypothetical protein